jgi:hypothetical protein
MSRSYHVTRRAAIRAFAEGDFEPTVEASDKSGVKSRERQQRQIEAVTGKPDARPA